MKPKKTKTGLCPEGVDLLLPWYLNRTLEKEEREAVKKHLRSCSICQKELTAIKREQEIYESASEEIPVPQTFPHLAAAIEKRERTIWQRIAPLIPRPQPTVATALIVAQLLIIIGLLGLLTLNPWGAGEKIYYTLSGPQTIEGKGPQLTILFQEGIEEQTLREVILDINGTIVRGPTPMGVYTVELPPNITSEGLQGVISALRQKSDIIRFVETEGG